MKETKLSSYIGPIKEKSDMNGRIEKHMIKPATFFPQMINAVGPGQMIGDQDAA